METGKETEKFISDWLASAPGFSVLVELETVNDECIRIKKLQTWPSDRIGKGEATRALDILCRLADSHHIALCGDAMPYATQENAAIRLRLWLARFGFEPKSEGDRGLELYRAPRKTINMPAGRA